jgi:LysR family transcriptional regulator, low CO2-responsive transcriptional regulator
MTIRHTTLRQLAVFEAAARLLSFTRAAEELHLTQPAVSMQIKELEDNAGLPLFERLGRKLFLTDAGRELLGHARDMLRALGDAEVTLDALKGLRGGRVSIAVTSTAKYFAPQLLARFRKQQPAVELRLAVNNRDAVIEQLAGNEVDLAIMGRAPSAPDTVGEVFAPHPFVVVAAPDHPLVRRRRVALAALSHETFLVREPGSGTRSAMQQFFSDNGIAIQVGMEIASNETIKQAVMAGIGISFISRHTVGFELQSGRLAAVDVIGLPVLRHWYVVHLVAKRLSPSAAAFKAFVLNQGRAILKAHVGVD